MDDREITRSVDRGDLDPVRGGTRLDRSGEIHLHVPEVPDRPEPSLLEHRRSGPVARVDRVAESAVGVSVQEPDRAILDPTEERGADAPPTIGGVHDPPGLDERWLVSPGLRVPHDRPGVVDRDPGVGRQVEVRAAPGTLDEVRAEDDLPAVVELVRDEHVGHRLQLVAGRSPQFVAVGKSHGREGYRTRLRH